MSDHRDIPATAVPFEKTVPQRNCEFRIRSAFIPGCEGVAPAKDFSTIARELGCSIDQVRRAYISGMNKLGYSRQLEELYYQFLELRAESSRKIATPYARSMRVAVVDVAPHELVSSEGAK